MRRKRRASPSCPLLRLCALVIDPGRLAGFLPGKRQLLPGTEKVWQAWRIYQESVQAIAAWDAARSTDGSG